VKLISLRIDRKRWCRGGINGDASLLNGEGAMCCLGFACKKLGLTPKQINNVGLPADVADRSKLGLLVNTKGGTRKLAQDAAGLNDNPDLEESDREVALVPVLKKLGFKVSFVG
jgi:hypothetical protein